MEGVAMVPEFLYISYTYGTTTFLPFLPMPPCSCLPCGISVCENVFISGCDCAVTHVDGQNVG